MSIAPPTDLEILYRDDDLLVVNKAVGLHTDEVEKRCNESFPQIQSAHRLDRDTSGALLLAFPHCHATVAQMFKSPGEVEKIYWAGLSAGYDWVDAERTEYLFKGFIGSRYRSSKRSHVSFENSFRGYHSVRPITHAVRQFPSGELAEFQRVFTGQPVEVKLITGARHQIRAYFEFKKAPIVGDAVYNPTQTAARLELHCRSLQLKHPRTQALIKIVAPLH